MTEEEFWAIWAHKPMDVTVTIQLDEEEYELTETFYCERPGRPRIYRRPYFEVDTVNKTVTVKYFEPDEN